MVRLNLLALALCACSQVATPVTAPAEDGLRVPGWTAYAHPDPDALAIRSPQGAEAWSDGREQLVWHGWFANSGQLQASVEATLATGRTATLQLRLAGQERSASFTGAGDRPVTVTFPPFDLVTLGYHELVLQGTARSGQDYGAIAALTLGGDAAAGAQFNLKPRRNAASVHLSYPTDKDAQGTAFYNEVTVRAEPRWTYYMACGFQRGYFGIQVNSDTERRVIFSVWDSGGEATDRAKVDAPDRVTLVAKGEGVVAGDFGNEGTGAHSHLVYPWTAGTTYRFLVTAKPDGTRTDYSGWFWFPERKAWGLIATFRAPRDGGGLRGLYSFAENFTGANGDQRRCAEFGNQWLRTASGWTELLGARFSHDQTGEADRRDRAAGVVDGRFYLATGGFVDEPLPSGALLHRPALLKAPADLPAP